MWCNGIRFVFLSNVVHLNRKMSKKLNLESLSSSRILRSSKKSSTNLSLATSEYFNQEPADTTRIEQKKQLVKTRINKNKSPKKTKLEDVKTETVDSEEEDSCADQDNKKRKHVTIKCEQTEDVKPVVNDFKDNKDKKIEFKWMPTNWHETLNNIREMRANATAPVDTMGCDRCADSEASPKISRYQSLLALMLSSQTKDQVTYAAMQCLRKHGCTPEKIFQTEIVELQKLIYPAGFYKTKAENIKKATKILLEQYDGDIPDTVEGLCKLPGVGPKMAHICMKVAWGQVTGIGVDTHVHRIANRLEWVPKSTKTPEETRKGLEEWLPHELWSEVNHLLVGFGQEICKPRDPNCKDCNNRNICPYYQKNTLQNDKKLTKKTNGAKKSPNYR